MTDSQFHPLCWVNTKGLQLVSLGSTHELIVVHTLLMLTSLNSNPIETPSNRIFAGQKLTNSNS